MCTPCRGAQHPPPHCRCRPAILVLMPLGCDCFGVEWGPNMQHALHLQAASVASASTAAPHTPTNQAHMSMQSQGTLGSRRCAAAAGMPGSQARAVRAAPRQCWGLFLTLCSGCAVCSTATGSMLLSQDLLMRYIKSQASLCAAANGIDTDLSCWNCGWHGRAAC
jgi:hypothetical protein